MKICSIIRASVLSGICARENVRIGEGLLEGDGDNKPLKWREDGFRECVISNSLYEAHQRMPVFEGLTEFEITNLHKDVFQERFFHYSKVTGNFYEKNSQRNVFLISGRLIVYQRDEQTVTCRRMRVK